MDNDVFFAQIKPLFGSFTQSQIDGLNALLMAMQVRGVTDLRYQAYMLATAFHETAKSMQPIREIGGRSYFTKMYDVTGSRPKLARANGNTDAGDGAKYFGRGYVQLTWKSNYHKAGVFLGVDLVANPDLALDAENAAQIMCVGMMDGWFTGRKLAHYFSSAQNDWVNARRIINGTDKAEAIARYALKFYDALQKSV